MDAPRLETRRLSKAYPGTLALDGVSLAFEGGKVHALVGKNGAGKSTLVRILSGATRPTGGEVLVAGRHARFGSPREALAQGIATVHQELSLVPALSVGENILLGRLPRRRGLLRMAIDWREVESRARAVLGGMGVRLDVREKVARLPLAHQQIVEIARAMSFDPYAVLLDEPTAGLARAEAERLFGLVRALARRGVAILYVTHRLGELREIADTVTALRDGRHVATIPAADADPRTLAGLMFGETARSPLRVTPEARGEPVLEVRGLTVGDRLREVHFTLHRGEVLGIAGLLGSGRTELLQAIFGAVRADGGEVVIGGESLRPSSPAAMKARGVGLVPEDRKAKGLALPLSTIDNACMASLDRIGRRGVVTRARERRAIGPWMRRLQVAVADPEQPVSSLSGGNQQKIVIGKWLGTFPRVLLLDEPTRGIDVQARQQVFEIIRGLAGEGIASVFVSSELEELLEVCDRILVLRSGRIVHEARREDLPLDRLLSLCMSE